MNANKDRAEFEAWASAYGLNTESSGSPELYDSHRTNVARDAWQAARSRAGAVPAGYALVPVVPTVEMQDEGAQAANAEHGRHNCASIGYGHAEVVYAAMLAAAPEPQQGDTNAELRRLCALSATVVRAAFFAAEDSEDDGSEFIRVDRQSWETLAASLDALDELPGIDDGQLRHGHATLADLIERAIGGRNER